VIADVHGICTSMTRSGENGDIYVHIIYIPIYIYSGWDINRRGLELGVGGKALSEGCVGGFAILMAGLLLEWGDGISWLKHSQMMPETCRNFARNIQK
jgi:hypothetical protein